MYLHTANNRTAQNFFGRLREIEKMAIRKASPGELEYLRQADFLTDNLTVEAMAEVKQVVDADFTALSAKPQAFPRNWSV